MPPQRRPLLWSRSVETLLVRESTGRLFDWHQNNFIRREMVLNILWYFRPLKALKKHSIKQQQQYLWTTGGLQAPEKWSMWFAWFGWNSGVIWSSVWYLSKLEQPCLYHLKFLDGFQGQHYAEHIIQQFIVQSKAGSLQTPVHRPDPAASDYPSACSNGEGFPFQATASIFLQLTFSETWVATSLRKLGHSVFWGNTSGNSCLAQVGKKGFTTVSLHPDG